MLNLGGGLPVHHTQPVPTAEEIHTQTMAAFHELFNRDEIELIIEPGRVIVGEAGTLISTVIGTADRGGESWISLDAGVFNALFEATQGFRYELATDRHGPRQPHVLAGPSCDSVDVITNEVWLPNLRVGDRLYFLNAGAYTTSYASRFNGFGPPTVYIADGSNRISEYGSIRPYVD